MKTHARNAKDSTNLDFLRSVAVLSVFGIHLANALTYMRYNEQIAKFGMMGVILFFVHTSLVLMQSLDRSNLDGINLIISFYIRRAFRIYPLSMLCVTIVVIFSWPGIMTYMVNMGLMQNLFYSIPSVWGVLWSLPLEVQMYIALPILFIIFRNRPVWQLIALWAFSMMLGTAYNLVTARFNTISYSPCFLCGILSWRIMRKDKNIQLPGWLWPCMLSTMIILWNYFGNQREPWNRGLFCICIGLAIPYFSDIRSRWITIPAKQIAKYSYGIYLAHPLAIRIAMQANGIMRWAILIGLAVLIPVLAFHMLENPMIQMGKRVADWVIKPRNLPQAS